MKQSSMTDAAHEAPLYETQLTENQKDEARNLNNEI
jgi:hypothetical protein